MSKKIVYAVIAVLFLLILLTLKVDIQSVRSESNTIIVPDDYTKIQWAIGNATAGDTIFIHNGIYYEHLDVNKPLTLVGQSKESTIIDGNRTETVIKVTANNVAISGFTVQNSNQSASTSYAGIRLSGRECNITGNHVTRNKIGIFVTSQKSRIAENTVTNNGQGIALYDSSEVTVEANNVTANTVGISLAYSSNNLIIANRVANSSTGGHGITLSSNSFNNTILRNNIIRNGHGIWLSDSSNNMIVNNTIANNKILGIELSSSEDNTIYHNNFVGNLKHVVVNRPNTWDDGYPSGGNYWSDFEERYPTVEDVYSGPNQDELGSDGFWDRPYEIDENNEDNYPIVPEFSSTISLPLFMIATLLALIAYKRKHTL